VTTEDDTQIQYSRWTRFIAWLNQWIVEQFSPRPTITVRKKNLTRQGKPDRVSRTEEARERKSLAQPAPVLLADTPQAPITKPWELGGVTPDMDPDVVRPALMGSLFDALDECDSEAGEAFISRLIRNLGTDQLDLPPFPDVAWRLDTLLRLGDPPLLRVVKIVRREPALVRRVWTQACSAFYARPPNSLDHAVARIGFDALWRIGMSACLYSEVFRVRGFQEDADAVRQHGIITADVAAWLSGKKLGGVYLAGLLHSVGKLLVYKAASPPRAGELPERELVERIAAEHHASIGVLVAHDWKLGPEVAAGIGYYHDPFQAPIQYQETAMQVQVANIATHTAQLSRLGQDCGGLLALLDLPGLNIDVARTIGKAHEVMDGLEAHPDPTDQPVLDVAE
jgi:HD-like signal output (HDOD) protein